jgi:hypothetical protein
MTTATFVYTGKCTHCGHTSCIVNEEESCNWDGCYECNAREWQHDRDNYCAKGNHEMYRGDPCIICGITADELDRELFLKDVAEHKADGNCEKGWHFNQSTWDPRTCTEGTCCAACGATSPDFGDTWVVG